MWRLVLSIGLIILALAQVVLLSFAPISPSFWDLIELGIVAAIGIQLLLDARAAQRLSLNWKRRLLGAWLVVLLATLASYLIKLFLYSSPLTQPLLLLALAVTTVALLIALWWQKLLKQGKIGDLRLGYLIGGIFWTVIASMTALSAAASFWDNDGGSFVATGGIDIPLRMLLAPLVMFIPFRMLYAGLPRNPGGLACRLRQGLLLLAALTCTGALLLSLKYISSQGIPLLRFYWLTYLAATSVWFITLMWLWNLWDMTKPSPIIETLS